MSVLLEQVNKLLGIPDHKAKWTANSKFVLMCFFFEKMVLEVDVKNLAALGVCSLNFKHPEGLCDSIYFIYHVTHAMLSGYQIKAPYLVFDNILNVPPTVDSAGKQLRFVKLLPKVSF